MKKENELIIAIILEAIAIMTIVAIIRLISRLF